MDGFISFAPELAAHVDGYDPRHFAKLAALEEGNFWFNARSRVITWAIGRYGPRRGTFMEIGCGTGFVLRAIAETFPGLTMHGSEVLTEGLRYASDRVGDVSLVQMDARAIPFAQEFEGIGMFDVLEHIQDDQVVLRAIERALRPGGHVILTVPQHEWLWSSADDHAGHVRRYHRPELLTKLRVAGLEPIFASSFVSLLLPAMVGARRLNSQPDVLAELSPPRSLNLLLTAVMTFERFLIRSGIRLPIGGSLLVVAAKVSG